METLKFSSTFLEKFSKNLRKVRIILENNCREARRNFGNTCGDLENVSSKVSKFNPRLLDTFECTAEICGMIFKYL